MDLIPDIQISLVELNQLMKERALAVLKRADISSLDAVGGAFWADILFVTGRERASLNSEQLEALGKASAGLDYLATQYALLSVYEEVEPTIDATGNSAGAVQQLEAYVLALGADTIVFLEAETAQKLQGFNRGVLAAHDYLNVVVVTDFFGSLAADSEQQERKKQAWQELQLARRQTAMR